MNVLLRVEHSSVSPLVSFLKYYFVTACSSDGRDGSGEKKNHGLLLKIPLRNDRKKEKKRSRSNTSFTYEV